MNAAVDITQSIPPWLEEICSRLRSNDASLTNLNLNIRRLTPVSCACLWDAIRDNSVLATLNLTNSLVPPIDLSPLMRGVANHASLKTLHLSYNKLVDVALVAVALRSNTSLEHIFVDYNRIQDDAVLLANALKHNKTLKTLHLGKNQVDDRGAIALAAMLTVNETLEWISLLSNSIQAPGLAALENALQQNVTLKFLEIDQNPGMTLEIRNRVTQLGLANGYGRYLLKTSGIPDGLWSNVLAASGGPANKMYFFLKSMPELCRTCLEDGDDDQSEMQVTDSF
jgi:Leucine Rich repeat